MLIDFQNKIGTHTCFRVDWIVHLAKVSMDDELVPNENKRHNISKEFQTYTLYAYMQAQQIYDRINLYSSPIMEM